MPDDDANAPGRGAECQAATSRRRLGWLRVAAYAALIALLGVALIAILYGGSLAVRWWQGIPDKELWVAAFAVFLHHLVMMSPWLVVELVGFILALVWWRRHPRVSLLVLLAIGLGVSASIGYSFLMIWLSCYSIQRGWRREQTMALNTLIGWSSTSLRAVELFLLLSAVFTDRVRKGRLPGLPPGSGGSEARAPGAAEGLNCKRVPTSEAGPSGTLSPPAPLS
jgi:hypothetical protein